MGMVSEAAIEETIKSVVFEIEKELETSSSPEVRAVLKKLGRFALAQFDFTLPRWAEGYKELFKE